LEGCPLAIPLALGSWVWVMGAEKLVSASPPKDGVPVEMNFFVGSVSVCDLTVSDVIESRLITPEDGKQVANHHAESRSRVSQKLVD
jgi:hypothetical protein